MNRLLAVAAILVLLAALPGPLARAADSPEDTLRKAQQLEQAGQVSGALDLFRAFVKDHPDHSQALDARYHLARCCDSLGLVDEAIDQLDQITRGGTPQFKKYPHRGDAFYLLGKLHGSLKNYDKAIAAFEALLAEGAGSGGQPGSGVSGSAALLDSDEVMDLCAGYYAILKKTDEAAAKFNILKRREGSRYAEPAAYKLVVLWIKAEKADLATAAIEELAAAFPNNPHIPGLIVQTADLFRGQKAPDKAIALCDQVVARFGKTPDAQMARYVVALCLKDRKDFAKAVEILGQIAKAAGSVKEPLAAEALFDAAGLYQSELNDPARAVQLYQEAAAVARDIDSERTKAIAEQCYFTLAEYHYQKKNYPVAMEFYLLLKQIGSKLNVTSRVMKCQSEMGVADGEHLGSPADLAIIRKKIDENPGTFIAAEGEVFLLDRSMADAAKANGDFKGLVDRYEAILAKYDKKVLSQQSLESYVRLQAGLCLAQDPARQSQIKAMAAFSKVVEGEPTGPYAVTAMENLALAADRAGERSQAFAAYKALYGKSLARLEAAKDDKEALKSASQYLKGVLSRADGGQSGPASQPDSIDQAVQLAQQTIERKGAFSALARDAQYYLGELYFLKKDYSSAARQFTQFIKIYGPKQDAAGNLADAPWRPANLDDGVLQIYEAAIRIAHSWYMQGHTQNMVKAYQWIVRNLNYRNVHVAEAQYWLAMELAKGADAEQLKPETKRALAEALWKNVVNPSLDFSDRKFAQQYHFWVSQHDSDAEQYVKTAALKAGKLFGEAGEHDKAAAIFELYLDLFSPGRRPAKAKPRAVEGDEMYSIARYALGRECIALGNVTRLIDCYKVYLRGLRDDRFRVSALRLLAYHAGKAGKYDEAIEAYATLLDEYGENSYDKTGAAMAVPRKDWLRLGATTWDGVRLPPPKDLDRGEVRFALGLLYWKQDAWAKCVQSLAPFIDDPAFGKSKSAGQALYMVGRSHQRLGDSKSAAAVIERLIREHPQFEAIDEACVDAAKCYCDLEQWADLDRLCKSFLANRPASERRPHIDLYAAVCLIGQGQTKDGLGRLRGIVDGDSYEDVKADACYYIGRQLAGGDHPDDAEAMKYFQKSLDIYPREPACLAAAKCCIRMKKLDQARGLLERIGREFSRKNPAADPKVFAEAKALLGEVLKQEAKGDK